MRILALDHGTVRIGVAVSDEMKLFAAPLEFIPATPPAGVMERLRQLIQEKDVELIVLGLPRNMDGSLGPQAREAQGFGERLVQEGVTVLYQDERLSSFEAEEAMRAAGLGSRRIREKVDQTAACVILERYLDSLGYNE